MTAAPNRNLLYAQAFADELVRSGVRLAVIAPGSRSTPLAVALAQQPDLRVVSIIDERCAAFFALGYGVATGEPAVLLCSSGTATANFHPAIIEAKYSRVPLIVLTADRPPELRESGANQTVDQIKMYGDHVLWSFDMPLPELQPPPVTLRSIRTAACRAVAISKGMAHSGACGPVHFNFPFRKPLEPIPVEGDPKHAPTPRRKGQPFTQFHRAPVPPPAAAIRDLAKFIRKNPRVLVVCGVGAANSSATSRGDAAFAHEVDMLSIMYSVVLLADPLSGVRYDVDASNTIGNYDNWLKDFDGPEPQVVIHFGAMPTSQVLEDYLNRISPLRRVWVSADGVWNDANHQIETFIHADPTLFVQALRSKLLAARYETPRAWYDLFVHQDIATRACLRTDVLDGAYFHGAVLWDVVDGLPQDRSSQLYVASSLAVRHLDQFGDAINKPIRAYGNRGASGIDGTISSALGAAAAHPDQPTVLVIGDLAFHHDMNGLMTITRTGIKLVIVLLNNDGGGIFQRLPIARYDPPYTELFLTPHGLTFEHAAQLYGIGYARASTHDEFAAAFSAALAAPSSTIIEVPCSIEHDEARRKEVVAAVREAIRTYKLPQLPPE
jgi:2-succinyl-5-enolpyruvyl-6-hydroxy-3-cyclohexene-1-carboxylate synthase